MKRSCVLLFALVLLAFTHPNLEGTYGLIRSISADNGSAGHFHIGLYLRGFGETRASDTYSDALIGTEALYQGGDLFFGLGYAFTDYLSLNAAGSYHGDDIRHDDADYSRASMGFGDTKLGLKLGFGPEHIKVGLYPFISLPTGEDRSDAAMTRDYFIFGDAEGNQGGVFRYFSSGAVDYGALFLLTLKSRLLTWDINLGGVDQNKNDDTGLWRNDYVVFNTGLSWNVGSFYPFIELSGIDINGKNQLIDIADDSVFGPNPVYVTPGIGLKTGHFNIDLAFDIRLEGDNTRPYPTSLTDSFNVTTGWGVAPPWAIILGVSYCYNLKPAKEIPGAIVGTVVDAKTKLPIMTNVAIYQEGVLIASQACDNQGAFKFSGLEPGIYTLQVMVIDYKPFSIDLLVKEDAITPCDIMLEPISKQGTLILHIIDIATKEPVTADVTIGDMSPETDVSTLEKTLLQGDYLIKVIAQDESYLPYERTINLKAGKTLEIEVALVKEEFKIVLPQVYFETAKAEIKPESYSVLNGAAETINKVFSGNADIKIEVQGHTDSRGSEAYNLQLSQDRADAVKGYLITKHGIDVTRLISRGYGESKPIASNETVEGLAQNRRVEFVIVEP